MKIELNPLKWFPAKAETKVIQHPSGFVVLAPKEPAANQHAALDVVMSGISLVPKSNTAKAEENTVASGKFVSVLEAVGKAFLKGLSFAVTYAIPVERLVALIFPSAAPAALGVASATGLIQNAVLAVEQKYAASGVQNGTGQQKLAEVLLLTEGAVTSLLKQDGITADTGYVSSLVNAVVAILNVQMATVAA